MPKIGLSKIDIYDVWEPDTSLSEDLMIDIPQKILDDFKDIMKKFYSVQNQLEMYYREWETE